MLKARLASITTGVLVLCAVVVTIAVVKREFVERPDEVDVSQTIRAIEIPEGLFDEGVWLGSKDAAVVVVELTRNARADGSGGASDETHPRRCGAGS